MSSIRLSFRLVSDKPVAFIIISIMLTLSLVSLNILASIFYSSLTSFRLAKQLDKFNYVYFQPEDPEKQSGLSSSYFGSDNEDDAESLMDAKENRDQTISRLKNVDFVSYKKHYSCTVDSGDFFMNENIAEIETLSDNMISQVKYPLKSGRWIDDKKDDDYVEAVISSDYNYLKTGDVFDAEIFSDYGEKGTDIRIKVVGILKDPVYCMQFNVSADTVASTELFGLYDAASAQCPLILCSDESVSEFTEDVFYEDDNCLVIFDDNISDSEMQDNLGILKEHGYAATKEIMEEGTKELLEPNFYLYLPIGIFLLLTSIIGLISMMILNVLQNRRNFAIYFISGCRWGQCIFINLMYILYPLIISVAGLMICFAVGRANGSTKMMFSSYNLILTVAFCVFVFLSSAVTPYLLMKNLTPKEIITNTSE